MEVFHRRNCYRFEVFFAIEDDPHASPKPSSTSLLSSSSPSNSPPPPPPNFSPLIPLLVLYRSCKNVLNISEDGTESTLREHYSPAIMMPVYYLDLSTPIDKITVSLFRHISALKIRKDVVSAIVDRIKNACVRLGDKAQCSTFTDSPLTVVIENSVSLVRCEKCIVKWEPMREAIEEEIAGHRGLPSQGVKLMKHLLPRVRVKEEEQGKGAGESVCTDAGRERKERYISSTETCMICLDEFSVGSFPRRLPCKHVFHGPCITKWLGLSRFCPICRHEMPSKGFLIDENH